MIAIVERPLPTRHMLAGAAAVVAIGTAYCLAYNAAAGRPESPVNAAGWALANLAPWFIAFEAAKRETAGRAVREHGFWIALAAVIVAATIASIVAGALVTSDSGALDFRLVRRLPAAALVVGLIVGGRMLRDKQARRIVPRGELPVDPAAIVHVSAAGNYVELHVGGRPRLHRLTMREAEALLAPHSFVRIHRSALINRRRLARVIVGKSHDQVLMDDGTRLAVGGRYRTALS